MARSLVNAPAKERLSQSARRLRDALRAKPGGFDFVQVMRLLQRLYPRRAQVGGWADPATEVARVSVPPSFAFPPSEVARIELDDESTDGAAPDQTPVPVDVRFFGLTGPQGVLPHLYTEHAAERARARDTAFRDFLDLFHHRLLSLYYRGWERHRPTVAAERGDENRLRTHLLDLVGAGTERLRQRSHIHPDLLAAYAGLLAHRARPAIGLATLIGDYFGVPATIEQFVGAWRPLQSGGQLALGDEGVDGQLGRAVIGDAVYDAHAAVRLRIGPLSRAQFDALLPGGKDHTMLRELAHLYADDEVGVIAQLILARDEVPATTLGAPQTPALGFGTWLRRQAPEHDPDDVSLALC